MRWNPRLHGYPRDLGKRDDESPADMIGRMFNDSDAEWRVKSWVAAEHQQNDDDGFMTAVQIPPKRQEETSK